MTWETEAENLGWMVQGMSGLQREQDLVDAACTLCSSQLPGVVGYRHRLVEGPTSLDSPVSPNTVQYLPPSRSQDMCVA